MTLTFDPTLAFNTAFDQELAAHPPNTQWKVAGKPTKANPHGEDADWWRAEGPVMVQRWVDWRARTPWDVWVAPDGTLGIELALTLPINGQVVKMFIDRIFATAPNNQRPVILDLKSGKPPVGLLQLGQYKVAVETAWPTVKIAGGAWWHARTGEMSGVHSLSRFTAGLIGAYSKRVMMIRKAGAFLPNVGSFCSKCDMGRYCAINNGVDSHLDPDHALMGA